MTPAISNIAWPASQRDAAYTAMEAAGVEGLEIAPGLFLADAADPFEPDSMVLESAVAAMRAFNLTPVSMQALTFGAEGIALFGNDAERAGFERALRRAITLAGRLSTPVMVFGSPRHRQIPPDMNHETATEIAIETFSRLGDAAAIEGTRLALEANPAVYGTNFMTDIAEATRIVEAVNHPAIGLNLDLGAQIMNGEAQFLEATLDRVMKRVVHVHVSEPQLAPAPADSALLKQLMSGLNKHRYAGAVSIEMRADRDDPIATVRTSLKRLTAVMPEAES